MKQLDDMGVFKLFGVEGKDIIRKQQEDIDFLERHRNRDG